ncbi:39S ribosomal protein L21, mitochondrial isoform X2 [Cephus cinctus]|uniref:Large ribosomal subunit protein bL21m n=1 Tax=Cephus cinctus TaxID=211228 RepID=A0AAJ7BZR9_CEPCN|nr:39S ribosomal protein L21, mitochondrial isoform X2 [Cephus cinctus]
MFPEISYFPSRSLQDFLDHSAIAITGSQVAGYRTRLPWIEKVPNYQVEVPDTTEEDLKLTDDVMKQINQQISTNNIGRLFAVVHVCGKQFKITENDIIIIQGYWPPTVGDKLKLEKVLLVGGSDFTLIGRPLVNRELVSIIATVIEKTTSHTKTHFRFKKRKQYRRINFCRIQHTMLRINSIQVEPNVGHLKEVEGLHSIY